MAYIQCKSGGGDAPVLLWTNPSPSSDFVAQTVSIDLTDYEAVIITVKGGPIFAGMTDQIVKKQTYDGFGKWITGDYQDDFHYCTQRKIISISNSGIEFDVGHGGMSYGTNNNYCIPTKIYGLKKSLT